MTEQMMSREQTLDPAAVEALSALMDGEAPGADAVAHACRAWRDDARLRESWHCYHLIGDVLRSDDLAAGATRDAAFLQRLRGRLEAEPVVLAPAALPVAAPRRARRWRWAGPAAVAAGFVAVAGVLVVTRAPQGEAAPAPALAEVNKLPAPTAGVPVAAPVPVAAVEADETVVNGKLLRDARIDRYLEAHQQFGGASVLGASMLRRAAVEAAPR